MADGEQANRKRASKRASRKSAPRPPTLPARWASQPLNCHPPIHLSIHPPCVGPDPQHRVLVAILPTTAACGQTVRQAGRQAGRQEAVQAARADAGLAHLCRAQWHTAEKRLNAACLLQLNPAARCAGEWQCRGVSVPLWTLRANPPKASKAAELLPLSCPISAASRAKKPSTAARCAPASGGSVPLASADVTAAEATTSGVMSPAGGQGQVRNGSGSTSVLSAQCKRAAIPG